MDRNVGLQAADFLLRGGRGSKLRREQNILDIFGKMSKFKVPILFLLDIFDKMSKFRVAILLNRTLLSHVASPLAIREDIVFMGLFLTISPPGSVLQGQRRPKEKANVFDVDFVLHFILKWSY